MLGAMTRAPVRFSLRDTPARDRDDLSAQPYLVDVLQQNDVHG